ncbi:MAG: hypothetical protein HZB56_12485 [Deltaproteobacteria bacterium]|nr:hypothetical protein [Deltaproteobacteria bacterium]
MSSTLRSFAAALALPALLACSAASTDPAAPQGAPQGVAVEVQPPSATLGFGGTTQFAAVVTGTINTSVTWSVQEASGGSVSASGLYTAPTSAGTYHVVATSAADGTKAAQAVITVQPVAPIAVTVAPATATVAAGATRTFTATVTGTTNAAVTWSVQEASGCGSITSGGVYTAPGAAATCHVVALSQANGTSAGTATVTVTAPAQVTVSVSPAAPSLDACRTQTFTATVTGTTTTAVDWAVTEGVAGGTVTAAGVYTSPDTAGTYHVTATTRTTPPVTASVAVVVSERVLSVAVNPPTVTVLPNGTAQFTATVTTTCGAVTAVQKVAVAR